MNRFVKYIFIFLTFLPIPYSFSQQTVSIDTLLSPELLIRSEFLKGGIEIKNITYRGSNQALGLFSCRSDLFPLKSGIVLSTGKATDVGGPNHSLKTSGAFHTPGDSALNRISRGWTEDACVVEFDFIPSSENIAFDFVFGSEEYPEYVNSVFNDVFAFLITNLSTNEKFNIASLPTTHEPITVNNVNHLKNIEFFVDNPAPNILYLMEKEDEINGKTNRKKQEAIDSYNQSLIKCKTPLCEEIQYDGFTTLITVSAKVNPEQTYHFKIAIADVSDALYDSGVLLKSHSFKSFDNFGQIKGDTTGELVVLPGVTRPLEKKKPDQETRPIPNNTPIKGVVYFDFNSSELKKESRSIIDSLSSILKQNPKRKIHITGHTDWKGSDSYNENLSRQRTESVKSRLEFLGISEDRISFDFNGEKSPAAKNSTEYGRSLNRRVEIEIFYSPH